MKYLLFNFKKVVPMIIIMAAIVLTVGLSLILLIPGIPLDRIFLQYNLYYYVVFCVIITSYDLDTNTVSRVIMHGIKRISIIISKMAVIVLGVMIICCVEVVICKMGGGTSISFFALFEMMLLSMMFVASISMLYNVCFSNRAILYIGLGILVSNYGYMLLNQSEKSRMVWVSHNPFYFLLKINYTGELGNTERLVLIGSTMCLFVVSFAIFERKELVKA